MGWRIRQIENRAEGGGRNILEKIFEHLEYFFGIMFEGISWNAHELVLSRNFCGGNKEGINNFTSIITSWCDRLLTLNTLSVVYENMV